MTTTKPRIAAVTVLYHPDTNVVANVLSYLDSVDVLYLIDNSENESTSRISALMANPKVIYVKNSSNLGIAEALNIGARMAMDAACNFLLTMDQDSAFKGNDCSDFVNYLEKLNMDDVAILSPLHSPLEKDKSRGDKVEEVDYVMTSGNLVNLKCFETIGPFRKELFIDHVDHEYCLRARQNHYKVLVAPDIVLNHALGVRRQVGILGIKFVSHSPLRTYYMIRNGLFVARMYKAIHPTFFRQNIVLALKEIVKIVFETDKITRFKMVVLAIRHYKKGRLGKLERR